MGYKIIICEDEPLFMAGLKADIEEYFKQETTAYEIETCSCGAEFEEKLGLVAKKGTAEDSMPTTAPSLIFMDISLGDRDGVALIEKYRATGGSRVPVIFVSSMEDRVLEGYEVNALAFLYKRNYKDKLGRTIERFFREYSNSVNVTAKSSGSIAVLSLHDIYYVEADGRKTLVHTEKTEVRDDRAIGAFIKDFPENLFFEVYKCIYVNLEHITRIDDDSVQLDNGSAVMMSRRKRKAVMNAVMQYIGG